MLKVGNPRPASPIDGALDSNPSTYHLSFTSPAEYIAIPLTETLIPSEGISSLVFTIQSYDNGVLSMWSQGRVILGYNGKVYSTYLTHDFWSIQFSYTIAVNGSVTAMSAAIPEGLAEGSVNLVVRSGCKYPTKMNANDDIPDESCLFFPDLSQKEYYSIQEGSLKGSILGECMIFAR
jgi:hypothetical protein